MSNNDMDIAKTPSRMFQKLTYREVNIENHGVCFFGKRAQVQDDQRHARVDPQ